MPHNFFQGFGINGAAIQVAVANRLSSDRFLIALQQTALRFYAAMAFNVWEFDPYKSPCARNESRKMNCGGSDNCGSPCGIDSKNLKIVLWG